MACTPYEIGDIFYYVDSTTYPDWSDSGKGLIYPYIQEARVSGMTIKSNGAWKIRLTKKRTSSVADYTEDEIKFRFLRYEGTSRI